MSTAAAADLVDVRLLGLPVQIHHRTSTHMQALQREFELIRRREADSSTVPHRLQALTNELHEQFGSFGEEPTGALEAAIERGDTSIDLLYRLPAAAGSAAVRLGELLDEADEFCRAGDHLLTLVAPVDAVRYRRWFLDEFARQTAGMAPVAWPDFVDEPLVPSDFPAEWSLSRSDGTACLTVVGPVDLVSAPALRGALVDLIPEVGRITVDLSDCDFLDSVGVGVLLAAVARADDHGAALRFRLSDAAARVIHITGLADRLSIER